MLRLIKISCSAILGFSILLPLTAQAQNFYKWVDANGSTHYTKTPPPKNAKKVGSVNTFNDTPSGSNYTPPPPPSQEQTNPLPEVVEPTQNVPQPPREYIPLPSPKVDPTTEITIPTLQNM